MEDQKPQPEERPQEEQQSASATPKRSTLPPQPAKRQGGKKRRRQKSSGGNVLVPILIGFGIAGVVVIGLIFFSLSMFTLPTTPEVSVPNQAILRLKHSGEVMERANSESLQLFGMKRTPDFRNVLQTIEEAATDDRIKGIYYKSGDIIAGYNKAKAIHQALVNFRNSGKFVYAFIETGSETDILIASAADSVFMPVEGIAEFNGFGAFNTYFKGTLGELGVKFHVEQFEQFKSAGEQYSRESFSQPAREQLTAILEQRTEDYVTTIANSRGLNHHELRERLSEGVYTADEFMKAGLVDRNTSSQYIKEVLGDTTSVKQVSLKNLFNSYAFTSDRGKRAIALINTSGPIVSGKESKGLFGGSNQIYSGDVVQWIRDAAEDDAVEAIVLRIDSPGGSVIASEEMYQEIVKARKQKPVYASMSDVAASGGYYMAMGCDSIFALPTTITGSIGVVLAIPNLSGMMNKIHADVDTISVTKNAFFMNPMMPFTEADKQRLHKTSEAIYFRFLDKVAAARGMTREEVRAIAGGRVWTGSDALSHGLIDGLASLHDVLAIVKANLNETDENPIAVRVFPRPEPTNFLTLLESLDQEEMQVATDMSKASLMREAMMEMLPAEVVNQLDYQMLVGDICSREFGAVALPSLYTIK